MNKKSLTESDICDRFITPAMEQAGWTNQQWRREYGFTDGKIIVRGKLVARGKKKRVDYLLFYKPNIPIAIIEAKDNKHTVGAGMQQGLGYASALDVPFVFSSNGDGFLLHDRTGTFPQKETQLSLEEFPSPEKLWQHYKLWKGLEDCDEALITSPNHMTMGGKTARYYQQLAINRAIEAIAAGQNRLLLVMATGTGKTFTAFNIIWRLWKNRTAKRILFLADRNILVDQTMTNDFKPFGQVMKKLNRKLYDETSGAVDTSYEIYLALYQAIVGGEDRESLYDKFPKDFFDLIVIDECHRGSASADSEWRQILDHFSPAVQLGLTATPKETKTVSNIDYFGEPVYTYSLKQGIEDGFLAPYKVIRVDLDKDLQGWRPEAGQIDDKGQEIEDRIYNQKDFDRTIVFPARTKAIAEKLSSFLHTTNPMNKTIVFCENIDHAERMRQALVNVPANKELVEQDHRYVMRITGDNEEGKAQLDNFIDPKRAFPVIATTSKLMTTGVDAQTCHVIVLDQRIQSMTEFKQIIGRGTRLKTDFGKHYFTIIDFRKATELFADPDWDGPPMQIFEVPEGSGDIPEPPEDDGDGVDPEEIDDVLEDPDGILSDPDGGFPEDEWPEEGDGTGDGLTEPPKKYKVSGVTFRVMAERVQYYGKDGKLITESLRDYTRKTVRQEFHSLDEFLKRWSQADRKQAIVDELLEQGVIIEALADKVGKDLDVFDLICHVAFDQPALSRKERAEEVKKRDVFAEYGDKARTVLEALLGKYADQGIQSIEKPVAALKLDPFTELGTTVELVKSFGGKEPYLKAVHALEKELYRPTG